MVKVGMRELAELVAAFPVLVERGACELDKLGKSSPSTVGIMCVPSWNVFW